MLASALFCTILWIIEPNFGLLAGLLIFAANLIDLDHLPVNQWSIKKIKSNYNRIISYPLHKIYVIFPIIFISMFTAYYWFGAGLFLHFLMDGIENIALFSGTFRWI